MLLQVRNLPFKNSLIALLQLRSPRRSRLFRITILFPNPIISSVVDVVLLSVPGTSCCGGVSPAPWTWVITDGTAKAGQDKRFPRIKHPTFEPIRNLVTADDQGTKSFDAWPIVCESQPNMHGLEQT